MPITFPRLKDQFYLPAKRIGLDDGFHLPYRVRYIRDKQVPCSQCEVRCGWSIAFLLGLLFGEASSLIDNGLWDTRGNETTGSQLFCSQENGFLKAVARHGGKQSGKIQRWQIPRLRGQDVRLMIEPT